MGADRYGPEIVKEGIPSIARGALVGALAVPFFLLPSPLTIEASDVYGGFALHARAAAVLAGVGLVWGALHVWLTGRGPDAPYPGRRVAAAVVAAAFAVAASWLAVSLGERLVVEIQDAPLPPGFTDPALALRAAGAVILLALVAARREGPTTTAAACTLVGLVAGGALLGDGAAVAELSPSLTLAARVVVGVALVAGLVGPRLPAGAGAVALIAGAGLLGTMAALLLLPDPSMFHNLTPGEEEVARRQLAVDRAALLRNGLAIGACVGTALAVALWTRREPLRPLFARPGWVLGHVALGAILSQAGSLLHRSAIVAGTLWGRPAGYLGQDALTRPPESAELGWVIAFVVGGLIASTGDGVRRWLGGVAIAWAAYAAGYAAHVGHPQLGLTTMVAPAAGSLVLAALWPALLAPRPGRRDPGNWLRWGLAVGGVAAGPLVFRFGAASLLSWAPAPTVVLVVGGAGGGLAGALLARPQLPGRLALDERIGGLLLVGISVLLAVYVAVFAGLFPTLCGAVTLALVAAVVVAFRRGGLPLGPLGRMRPGVVALAAPWMLFYVGFAAVTHYRLGPSEQTCERVLERTTATVLLDRYALDEEHRAALPYDALPIDDAGVVVASFKRTGIGKGGYLVALNTAAPEQRTFLTTVREDGPLWPERLVRDPTTGTTVVQILGVDAYALWELQVGGGPTLGAGRKVPLNWEPSNPGIDEARGRVVLSYVPNRNGGNPLVDVVDLDSMQIPNPREGMHNAVQMSDWATVDPGSGNYWVAALIGPLSLSLTEVSGNSLVPRRRLETYFPTVGMEVDPSRHRLLVTNVVGGDLVVIDTDNLRLRQRVSAGVFPRDVAIDRARSRMYVAGYGDGRVHRFAIDAEAVRPLGAIEVGPLLRGVGVDPSTGRVVAASGCGIFEVPPAD